MVNLNQLVFSNICIDIDTGKPFTGQIQSEERNVRCFSEYKDGYIVGKSTIDNKNGAWHQHNFWKKSGNNSYLSSMFLFDFNYRLKKKIDYLPLYNKDKSFVYDVAVIHREEFYISQDGIYKQYNFDRDIDIINQSYHQNTKEYNSKGIVIFNSDVTFIATEKVKYFKPDSFSTKGIFTTVTTKYNNNGKIKIQYKIKTKDITGEELPLDIIDCVLTIYHDNNKILCSTKKIGDTIIINCFDRLDNQIYNLNISYNDFIDMFMEIDKLKCSELSEFNFEKQLLKIFKGEK